MFPVELVGVFVLSSLGVLALLLSIRNELSMLKGILLSKFPIPDSAGTLGIEKPVPVPVNKLLSKVLGVSTFVFAPLVYPIFDILLAKPVD